MHANHIFAPYDIELPMIPNIKMVSLRSIVVTDLVETSDTQTNQFSPNAAWENYKSQSISELSNLWKGGDMTTAAKLMDFVHEKECKTCVEIGSFGGGLTYPIAKALNFQKQGVLYAVDAWDREAALEGVEDLWQIKQLGSINYGGVYRNFQNLLNQTSINTCCITMPRRPQEAASSFNDQSIDLLLMNQINSSKQNLENVILYLPKVKDEGYVWVYKAEQPANAKAIAYLMKHCKWIREESNGIYCVLFQKEKQISSPNSKQKKKWYEFFSN